MKKIIKTLFCVTVVLVVAMGFMLTASANDDITVTLDGKALTFDQKPVIVDGRTLVPLRGIFEAMGAKVEWNDETRTVTAIKDDITISLTIGDSAIYKNGETIILDVPAQIVNSRTMVPARAVSESFGAKVDWNSKRKYVIISTDSVLNAMLEKIYGIEEFVADFDIKMNVSGIPVTTRVKAGMDYKNEKAFTQAIVDMTLLKLTTVNVNGDGKTYIDENGKVSVIEADNIAVRDEAFFDEVICKFVAETDTHKIYDATVDVNNSQVNVKIYVDKSSCELTKLVIPEEVAKQIDSSISSEIEADVAFNTGKVMEMWNKYNK